MKVINFSEIENYQIINSIDEAPTDPEETNRIVEALINDNPNILLSKTKEELLEENIYFARHGPELINIKDTDAKVLQDSFGNLGPHEKLCVSGDKIGDWRGTEYWIKQTDIWVKRTIDHLGETFPEGAVLSEALTHIQHREIAEQAEEDRVMKLTQEQKVKEKEAALAAAKREVRILKEEAEIAGEKFDTTTEYQSRLAKIEAKYA